MSKRIDIHSSTITNSVIGDNNINIILYQEKEREFVVTRNVNIKPVYYFTGRETELQKLRQRVEEGCKSVLISGMGGIGKTQICRKLFEEYYNKQNKKELFSHIGYIEYNGDMGSSLMDCLRYKKQDNPKLNQEAAWRELEDLASKGKLLLFVDNVNRSMREDSGLQRLSHIPCAVLVSSRRVSFGDEFEPYKIGFLDVEQCKEIYEKIRFENSGRKVKLEEVQDLEYIIENLAGMHTLTVQLLAHLAWTKHWTVQRLRKELEENGFRLKFHKNGELINIQESYEKLYDLSELSGAEQNILEAFSVFPYIPLEVGICNQWLLSDAGVDEDDDILTGLYQKGWLQFDLKQESYALHPVFAQFIYEKCKPSIKNHFGLIKKCQECLEIPESGSILECQNYIPFAENILEKINMEKSVQTKFINNLAYVLQYMAKYKKAEKWYKIFSEIYESEWGESHPGTAMSYNNLAYVYEKQGEYSKAEELYKKSLKINEEIFGKNHLNIAINYNNLAGIYVTQGEYNKAIELHEKGLKIQENILGEKHPDIAISYNNLAGIYARQDEYSKAEELYQKSLKIMESVLGEEHLDTLSCYNNIARVYEKQGKYTKAKELYEKNLRINIKVLGENHPNIADCYSNIGGVYEKQGEYNKAEELLKKSLKIKEKILGDNNLDIANCYHDLAYLYVKQGNYSKAEALYKKSLRISKSILGEKHLDIAISYNNLAGIYVRQGEYEKAKELYEKSLKINESVLGKNHLNTASNYHNLAGICVRQREYNKAEELYEKSLKIRKRILGENHPDTAISYNDLAYMYESQEEYDKAEELYQKSLKIRERILGENHPDTAISYNNIAGVYEEQGEYSKAEELYEKSLKIMENILGDDHPDTAISYNSMAKVYVRQGNYHKALAYLFKAYQIFFLRYGLEHPTTKVLFKNMAKVYFKLNPEGNFIQWLEEKIKEE